jgi:hypothetical protein
LECRAIPSAATNRTGVGGDLIGKDYYLSILRTSGSGPGLRRLGFFGAFFFISSAWQVVW